MIRVPDANGLQRPIPEVLLGRKSSLKLRDLRALKGAHGAIKCWKVLGKEGTTCHKDLYLT